MTLRSVAAAVCALCLLMPASFGQSPSPNADILKMIQAGLPESVVVNKIRSGAGKWDTSVDALIALKQAGATPAELEALTAAPAAAPVAVTAPVGMTAGPSSSVLGGTLEMDHGKLWLHLPGNPRWENTTWNVEVVLVGGRVAYRVRCYAVTDNIPAKASTMYGDVVFEHDRMTFYPYGRIKWGFMGAQKDGHVQNQAATPEETVQTETWSYGEIKPEFRGEVVVLRKKEKYHFYWNDFFDTKPKMSMASQEFFIALLRDFDGTTAKVLAAAGITNPAQQLAGSSFAMPDVAGVRAIVEERNRDNVLHGGKSK